MLDWQTEVALARYHERVSDLEQHRIYDDELATGQQLFQVRGRILAFVGGSLVLLGRRLQSKSGRVGGTSNSLIAVTSQKTKVPDMYGCGHERLTKTVSVCER